MRKLFIAVAAVMVVSATAFTGNNKVQMTQSQMEDTVVVDSNKTQALALADDTIQSDTVVNAESFFLAMVNDTVTSDTVIKEEGTAAFLAMANDTVDTDTVVTTEEKSFYLAMTVAQPDTVVTDTTVTEKTAEQGIFLV